MVTRSGETSPRQLPMFPLGTVLFPSLPLLLHVFEPRYRALVSDCLDSDHQFGVVLITRGSEVGGGDQRASVGTVAHIEGARPLPDGRWVLATRGLYRITVAQWLSDAPYPRAMVRNDPGGAWKVDSEGDHQSFSVSGESTTLREAWPSELTRAHAAVKRARALLSELGQGPAMPQDLALDADPVTAGWELCGIAPVSAYDAQRLLEVDDVVQRLHLLAVTMDGLSEDLTRLLSQSGS